MSSFRDQAKAMADAYNEVQRNQQEIDEGLGALIKGGAKLIGRAAKPVAKAVKSTAKATGGAIKKPLRILV